MPQAIHRQSRRCFPRLAFIAALVFLAAPLFAQEKPKALSFGPFLQALWPDASARGITRKTFDAAFAGLTPDPRVAATSLRQPEYGTPVGT